MNRERGRLALFFLGVYLVFLGVNIGYYRLFSTGPGSRLLQVTFETLHEDHQEYVNAIYRMETGVYEFGYNNNAGISAFYLLLKKLAGDNFKLTAFMVNNAVFALCFFFCLRLLGALGLPLFYAALLFLNPATVYFSQLINKESFSLLAVLALTYFAARRSWLPFLLLVPLAGLLRLQLVLFGAALLFLTIGRGFIKRAFLSYVVLSLGGGLVAKFVGGFEPSHWKWGTSQANFWLNREFLLGSLVLNPARLLQYLKDLLFSGAFLQNGIIDLYKFRDFPSTIALVAALPLLAYLAVNVHVYAAGRAKAPVAAVTAYLLVLLMNPIIHSRYLFPVLPLLFLLAVYVAYDKFSAPALPPATEEAA
ncbi:MAG: hypothetical protein PHV33_11480 [Elusimicrobiales bacterium]|nr:hypothetical protein [Elusimicrobiales bacterium]